MVTDLKLATIVSRELDPFRPEPSCRGPTKEAKAVAVSTKTAESMRSAARRCQGPGLSALSRGTGSGVELATTTVPARKSYGARRLEFSRAREAVASDDPTNPTEKKAETG